jgi:hypothetical protein
MCETEGAAVQGGWWTMRAENGRFPGGRSKSALNARRARPETRPEINSSIPCTTFLF